MKGISSVEKREKLLKIIEVSQLLPYIFRSSSISGSLVERSLAHVLGGTAPTSKNFVDVLSSDGKIGYQVKSTNSSSILTWMRARLDEKNELIINSRKKDKTEAEKGLHDLGREIINKANAKIEDSFNAYPKLELLVYSRFIYEMQQYALYFEAPIMAKGDSSVFNPDNFKWFWEEIDDVLAEKNDDELGGDQATLLSIPIKNKKKTKEGKKRKPKKSLQGLYLPTGTIWWAWHGDTSDNQLHFRGESEWLQLIYDKYETVRDSYTSTINLTGDSVDFNELEEFLRSRKRFA